MTIYILDVLLSRFWISPLFYVWFLTVASWPAYRFLRRQVRWPGIPISWRIFHSLLWSTQSKALEWSMKHKVKESDSEIAQSCLTLCDPINCSLRGSSVHGIFQARVPEWASLSFSRGIFLIQRSNLRLPHCRQTLKPLSHQGSLFFEICWLCRIQQTVENSSRDGNTRPHYLPPEKSVCRSRRNS